MKTSPEREVTIQALDLTGAQRKLAAGKNILARSAERFAKGARRMMPFLTRLRSGLTPGQAILGSPPGAEPSGGPSLIVHLAAEDGAWAALTFDTVTLAVILEGTLGAGALSSDSDIEALFGKELTQAQRAVVSRVCDRVASDYAQALRTVSGIPFVVKSSQALRAGGSFDLPKDALRLDCSFDGLEIQAAVSLYLGSERVSAAGNEAEAVVNKAEDPEMVQALADVPVLVIAELGRVELGLRHLLSLRVGDTLRLSTPADEPIALKVGGVAKFDALPVIARGQMAVEVKGRKRNDA